MNSMFVFLLMNVALAGWPSCPGDLNPWSEESYTCCCKYQYVFVIRFPQNCKCIADGPGGDRCKEFGYESPNEHSFAGGVMDTISGFQHFKIRSMCSASTKDGSMLTEEEIKDIRDKAEKAREEKRAAKEAWEQAYDAQCFDADGRSTCADHEVCYWQGKAKAKYLPPSAPGGGGWYNVPASDDSILARLRPWHDRGRELVAEYARAAWDKDRYGGGELLEESEKLCLCGGHSKYTYQTRQFGRENDGQAITAERRDISGGKCVLCPGSDDSTQLRYEGRFVQKVSGRGIKLFKNGEVMCGAAGSLAEVALSSEGVGEVLPADERPGRMVRRHE